MKRKRLLILLLLALLVPWAANAQQALPYSYGFENGNLSTDGWTRTSTSSSGISSDAAHTGSYGFLFSYNISSDVYLVSPTFTGGTNGIDVTFYYAAYSSYYPDHFYVGYTTDANADPSTYTYGSEINSTTTWQLYEGTLPAGTVRMAIKYDVDNYDDGYYLFLDDFSFEASSPCAKPTDLDIAYTEGATTATVTWSGNARTYNIEVNGTVTEGVTSPYTINNVTTATTYTVKVQADCGEYQSGWVSDSFFSGCPNSFAIPYAYGFEDEGVINCWSGEGNGGVDTQDINYIHTGNGCFIFLYTSQPPQYLVSPMLTGIQNGLHVEFWYRQYEYGEETFQVGYSSTYDPENPDYDSFVWGDEITASTTYQRFSANYPATTKYVAVKHTSNNQYYLFLDDFLFEESASCLEPTNVLVSNETTTGASINWTAGATETAWDLFVTDDATVVPGDATTPTVANTSTKPYPLTNLNPATIYYVYVRAKCDANTPSTWSSPAIFNTKCEGMALPYSCDFEEGALSVCWNTINANTAYNNIGVMAPSSSSTNKVLYFYIGSSTGTLAAVLPEVDAAYPLNGYQITFDACYANSNYSSMTSGKLGIGIMTDPTDFTTFELVNEVNITDAFSSFGTYTVKFNNYSGSGRYIAIRNVYTSSGYVLIDNLEVNPLPSCFEPEGLVVSNITHNGATFTWDEVEGANYQYFTSTELVENPSDEQFTGEVNGDHTVTLSTFSGNETYYFYLRRNCGGEDGFSTPVYAMFHTLCNPTDITETEAFAENFTGYTGTAYNAAGVMPDCWDAYTANTYKPHVVPSDDTYNYFSSNALVMPGGSSYYSYAALPEFSNALNTLQISFKWANNSYYYYDDWDDEEYYYGTLYLGYIKENDVNYNTFTPIQYFYPDDDNWHKVETVDPIMLNNLPTDAVRLVFRWYSYYGSVDYCCVIDDVEVSLIPTCWQPQNLAASSVSNEGAVLTWERHTMGNETAWVLQYGTDNTFAEETFTEVEVEVESATDAPTYTIENGLTAETTYYARVKPACDTEGKLWSEVATFETEPDCAVPTSLAVVPNSETPHGATITWNGRNESFIVEYGEVEEGELLNANFDDGQIPSYFTNSTTYPWTITSDDKHAGTYSIKSGGANSKSSDLTLEVNLPSVGTITFWARVSSEENYDYGYFLIDNSTKFSVSGETDWTEYTYNLAAGTHTLVWRYSKDPSYYDGDDCFYVDDIVIVSGTVSTWVFAGNAENVENTGTFTFDDNEVFDPETTYMARVKGVCGTITTEACAPISFTTTEACPAPTGLQLVSNTANSITVTWSQTGGISSWLMRYKKSNETTWSDAITVSGTANTPGNVTIGTELASGTFYKVQVAADCDPEFEHPLEGIFNTLCGGPIEITEEAPYTQDFEAPVVTASYNSQTGIEVPVCWDNYSDNTYNYVYAKPHLLKAGAEYNYASSGQVLYFYGSGNGYAALPEFTNPLNTLQISFKYATESSSNGTLTLGYITAEDEDYNTFHALKSFSASSNSYQKFVNVEPLLLDTLPDTAARLVFRWYYDYQWGCNIDDIEVSIAPFVQRTQLAAGWNWVSFYVEADDLLEQLETSLGESGLEIWNSEVGTQYYPDFGWYGDLDDIGMNNSETYLVKTSAACEVVLVGERANPALHTITINPGWNWIGYPCAETMTLEEVLSGFEPEGGDKIANSDDYTEYYPDFGWWGDVETFNPGRGYMYYSASSVTKTITFTAATRGIRRTNP